jgi:hypothetical protein
MKFYGRRGSGSRSSLAATQEAEVLEVGQDKIAGACKASKWPPYFALQGTSTPASLPSPK